MKKTLIIAEAGVNHNGDINNAIRLIDAAVGAGVDYIKFQTFKAEKLVSKNAKKAEYQIQNMGGEEDSQYAMLKKLELSLQDHETLINYCKSKGIQFFSTAFDLDSLQYLKDIGLELVKIPSGEITNLPYLRKAAKLFSKVILSTGMSTMDDISSAVDVFQTEGIFDITILHCNTEYPTPLEDVNLKAMLAIKEQFQTEVGYSDHTLGIEVPIAAVALGASVIEKHFTLDKTMPGPDHAASLEPVELVNMVAAIRNIELAMKGDGLKTPSQSELKNIAVARKSIVAARSIKRGELLSEDNLTVKRPGTGISPMHWDEIIGKIANRNFDEDDLIEV
ncbi:N-acetylneuraminate synthase [Sphingobacterium paramultivorum]|uniref:N-acetylneuraminate synthase n=1 Tax=Sphingobacterium paramultivorum TaxID=2886510 RepID=A0A7G5E726_9SPHI|nr:N-acetylneuraminate synthase [Sphingobacterium paramultivorum]QMV69801.1 N-acetylneuraminate synthase [Sphingobacterium paramultivorum]WSO13628.1 N-acetylneuraminate synthase [Sphingobacterium paramultivorum]